MRFIEAIGGHPSITQKEIMISLYTDVIDICSTQRAAVQDLDHDFSLNPQL
jgi:hypothetical protein